MRPLLRVVVLLLATLSLPLVAHADSLTYDFVTSNTPYGIITTSLPASPTPQAYTADFFKLKIPLIVDGDPMTIPVKFFTAAAGGGAKGHGVRERGPVLFTGPTSDPTFLTGTFNFDGFTLTIKPETPPIPEPSTLLLFATGAFACCWFLKRRVALQQ